MQCLLRLQQIPPRIVDDQRPHCENLMRLFEDASSSAQVAVSRALEFKHVGFRWSDDLRTEVKKAADSVAKDLRSELEPKRQDSCLRALIQELNSCMQDSLAQFSANAKNPEGRRILTRLVAILRFAAYVHEELAGSPRYPEEHRAAAKQLVQSTRQALLDLFNSALDEFLTAVRACTSWTAINNKSLACDAIVSVLSTAMSSAEGKVLHPEDIDSFLQAQKTMMKMIENAERAAGYINDRADFVKTVEAHALKEIIKHLDTLKSLPSDFFSVVRGFSGRTDAGVAGSGNDREHEQGRKDREHTYDGQRKDREPEREHERRKGEGSTTCTDVGSRASARTATISSAAAAAAAATTHAYERKDRECKGQDFTASTDVGSPACSSSSSSSSGAAAAAAASAAHAAALEKSGLLSYEEACALLSARIAAGQAAVEKRLQDERFRQVGEFLSNLAGFSATDKHPDVTECARIAHEKSVRSIFDFKLAVESALERHLEAPDRAKRGIEVSQVGSRQRRLQRELLGTVSCSFPFLFFFFFFFFFHVILRLYHDNFSPLSSSN